MAVKLASGKSCRRRRLLLEQLENRLTLTGDAVLAVNPAFAFEGDSGMADLNFTVTLSQASATPVTVHYFTFGNGATSNVDFAQTGDTIVFDPGQTSQTVGVVIFGDTEIESDESFYFVLDNPIGATLGEDYYALGTIGNDDSPGNIAPVATGESYETSEDYPLAVYGLGVLANDYDPDGAFLEALVVSGPAHGTLQLDSGGSFTYYPDQDYFGTDSFTYRVRDAGTLSALATVSLTVWGMDDPIDLTVPGPQTTAEEAPITFSTANDNAITVTDIESPRVLVALLANNGTVTVQNTADLEFPYPENNGTSYVGFYADSPAEANAALEDLLFTPDANFNGTAHLSVLVQDLSEPSIYYYVEDYDDIAITVTGVNDPPLAFHDAYELAEDQQLVVPDIGVLQNDYDIEWTVLSGGEDIPLAAVLVDAPAHGSLTLNSGGGFTYTPDANYSGTDSFTYRAADESLQSNIATVTLTIWGMNDPVQIAVPGPQTVVEDGSITFSAAGGNAFSVSDLESPTLIVALLAQDGILTLPSTAGLEFPFPESTNNSPSITFYADNPAEANAALDGLIFTPNANFHGQVPLSLFVQDTSFITFPHQEAFDYSLITVTPVNDAPVAANDFYTAEAGAPLVATLGGGGDGLGVLVNDHDVDMELLTAVLVDGPAHGTLEFNADGTFTYTAEPAYTGIDTFTYRAFDGQVESGLATATFTVVHTNEAPVASNDSYSVDEDGVLTISAPGILGNDVDADNDSLTASLVSGASHGVVTLNPDGSFTYTPGANYHGSDSFTYRANDGELNSNVVTVAITVNSVHDAPVAVNDAYSVNEDQTLNIAPTPGVTSLTMVSEPGDYIGQGLSYSFTPQTGTFMANRNFDNGVSLVYGASGQSWFLDFAAPQEANLTPGYYANATRWPFQADNVPGLDVTGNGRASNTLTGNFTVTQALYAADGKVLRFAATFEQHSEGLPPALTGEIKFNQGDGPSGILINDANSEGQPLTIIVVDSPAHGTLAMNVDGSFKYTPNANYHGSDSFTYKLSDGVSESNLATVALTVNPVNDFPNANHDSYAVAEDNVLAVAAPGVLSNDTDVEGDNLTANLVTSPTHGSLVFNANGSFVYTPHANYNGSDSFKYAAHDGSSFSFIRTVTLNVTSVNDAPVATGESYTTAEDTPLVVAAAGVLGNDTDLEGSALSAVLVTGPAHGALTLNADGSFTYTPTANYHGSDSFTYQASDGSLSNIATVSLTISAISAVNDAPTAIGDTYTVDEDQSLTIEAAGVLVNDGDVDGDSLSALLISGPAHGTLNLNADGSFTYTPSANYHGSDSFTYQASDGSLSSNAATVTLTVAPVNDAPLADAGPDQTVAEGTTVAFAAAVADADGDTLSYLWDFGDGVTSTAAAPSHLYEDDGSYTVTLTVGDGQGGVAAATLAVTVQNVAPTLTLAGAATVDEASVFTLNLDASDPGQDTIAGWTIDWGDGNLETVTGNPDSVSHTYADGPGNYPISATASDEDGTFSAAGSLSVAVENVAPTASLSGPATGVRGQLRMFALTAVDPSASDQADFFTFNIDWGDGSTQTIAGSAGQQVGHIYTNTGTFTVQITATDKDGGTSVGEQQTILIKTVDVQGGVLAIGGTTADDSITVAPLDASGDLVVTINGASQGTFSPPAQIVAYGRSGNDQIKLNTKKIGPTTYSVTTPAVLFGDAGNDSLDARGSTANNILVGGDGGDTLQGGSGRDLLFGGLGADTLRGNGGDDLVIGNSTDYDDDLMALTALLAEWGRTDTNYNTRINHLNGNAPGGLNGDYFLNNNTVHDDALIDQLDGDAGSDWFFYTASGSNKDKLNDLVAGEVATPQ